MPDLGQFGQDVLVGLGAPVTQGNLNTIADVADTEGINNYYNPFNIEWHPGDNPAWQGYASFNSVGVQKYASYQDGVNATVAYLKGNSHWAPYVSALRNNANAQGALQAAYTWAKLKTVSGVQAVSELGQNLGGGTVTGGTNTLDLSFDGTAASIASYLTAHDPGYVWTFGTTTNGDRAWSGTPTTAGGTVQTLNNAGALALYESLGGIGGSAQGGTTSIYDGPGAGVVAWTASLGTLLANVDDPTFWKRVGIGVLGVVVIGVAAYMLLRSDGHAPSPAHLAEGIAVA